MTYLEQGENYRKIDGFTLHRIDPHGFWIVKTEKGPVPRELDQMFTDTRFARIAIEAYRKANPKKEK